MSKFDKLILKLLSGNADKNFVFSDLIILLEKFDFKERIKAVTISFIRWYRRNHKHTIARQKAKAYHVKQVREILIKKN